MAEVTMTPYVPPGGGEKEDPMYWLMAPGLVLGILVVVAFECKSKKPAKELLEQQHLSVSNHALLFPSPLVQTS